MKTDEEVRLLAAQRRSESVKRWTHTELAIAATHDEREWHERNAIPILVKQAEEIQWLREELKRKNIEVGRLTALSS